MDKISTPLKNASEATVRDNKLQPSRVTIERLRQYARVVFPAPVGPVLIIN